MNTTVAWDQRAHTPPAILVTLAWFLLHVAIIYRVELEPRSSHSPCCCRRCNTDVRSLGDKLHDAEACSVCLSRSAVRRADSHPAQDPGDLCISGRRNMCCKLRWHCNKGGRILLSCRVKWSSTEKIEHSWAKVKIRTSVLLSSLQISLVPRPSHRLYMQTVESLRTEALCYHEDRLKYYFLC